MTAAQIKAQLVEFKREQDMAFLSLDEAKIRAFYTKWNGRDMPAHPEVFWGSVHKAITGLTTMPRAMRLASKRWLEERGYRSLDDGDLSETPNQKNKPNQTQ